MAAPTYVSGLTDVYAGAGSTSGWSAIGGGASGLNAETDYYVQGTGMTSKNAWAGATKGMIRDCTTLTVPSGDAIFMWVTHLTPNSLDTEAGGGVRMLVGSASGTYSEYYVAGSDTWIYDQRWLCAVVDPTIAGDVGGVPTNDNFVGGLADLPSGGPTKGAPFGIDAIRYGRAFNVTNGDLSNGYATFEGAAAYNDVSTRRYGQIQKSQGSFFHQGLFAMGSPITAVDFRDQDKTVFTFRTPHVGSTFNGFEVDNASSRVDWTNIAFVQLDDSSRPTASKSYFDMIANATVNLLGCSFTNWSTFDFDSNATITAAFQGCGQITCSGAADLTGSSVAGFEGTVNTSALIWNINSDPGGSLDDMEFTKGTAATHAIEFGANIPATINLNGLVFNGYNAANNQNDSALHFKDTSGTITVNYSGTAPSYRTDGATISLVQTNNLTVTVDQDNNTEIRVMDAGTQTVIAGIETIGATKSWTTGIDATSYPSVDVNMISLDYGIQRRTSFSMTGGDKTIDFQQSADRQYENL